NGFLVVLDSFRDLTDGVVVESEIHVGRGIAWIEFNRFKRYGNALVVPAHKVKHKSESSHVAARQRIKLRRALCMLNRLFRSSEGGQASGIKGVHLWVVRTDFKRSSESALGREPVPVIVKGAQTNGCIRFAGGTIQCKCLLSGGFRARKCLRRRHCSVWRES